MHQVCCGSNIQFVSPAQRPRSLQLQSQLDKLQQDLDNKRYQQMVADITSEERGFEAARDAGFAPTTKLQLSFGLHVIVTMGTFFALGYYGGKLGTSNPAWVSCMASVCLCAGRSLQMDPLPMSERYGCTLYKSV